MGTVYKRNQIWWIKYELPREADGNRKYKAESCKGMTKREAEFLLAEKERAIRRGEYTSTKHTVTSFLEEWLEYARPSLASSTAAMYGYIINAHVTPKLGGVKLSDLTALQVQKLYRALQKGGSTRAPLSAKSIRNLHGLLHKALGQAVKWSLIPNNACDSVEPPKIVKPNVQAVGAVDLQRLISTVENTGEWRLPILISIFTGMRRGEVLALRWSDYNASIRTLAVCRALSQYSGAVTVKSTKTERARVVLLPEQLAELLDAHAKTSEHNAPGDYICAGKNGAPMAPKRFSEVFTRLARKLDLPITLHGLRHSHATMLIAAGVPIKAISERLGHSDTNVTLNVYAHVLPTMQQQAVDALSGLNTDQT